MAEIHALVPTENTVADVVGLCPHGNPGHILYHAQLEEILHAPEQKWVIGIIANLEAMHDKAKSSTMPPEGDHGSIDTRPLPRRGSNVEFKKPIPKGNRE
ncbi:unnamed protein product [marine sediment metagenome]|uniref:Uncharacterized protein n=1 Tax=marine sediment metagenome TaxID=412755 RepID=X0SE71_9ZZZZ